MKLDISKAADRMEWPFLEKMMEQIGFNDCWISRVMTWVSTTSYGVLINGVPGSTIFPSKGIWQGDFLSPYLYLICVEGLSCMLHKVEHNTLLKRVKVGHGVPSITHLFLLTTA